MLLAGNPSASDRLLELIVRVWFSVVVPVMVTFPEGFVFVLTAVLIVPDAVLVSSSVVPCKSIKDNFNLTLLPTSSFVSV